MILHEAMHSLCILFSININLYVKLLWSVLLLSEAQTHRHLSMSSFTGCSLRRNYSLQIINATRAHLLTPFLPYRAWQKHIGCAKGFLHVSGLQKCNSSSWFGGRKIHALTYQHDKDITRSFGCSDSSDNLGNHSDANCRRWIDLTLV